MNLFAIVESRGFDAFKHEVILYKWYYMNVNISMTHDNLHEIASLESIVPILLTKFEDTNDYEACCCSSRLGRNLLRVSAAGILSACGAWYAGFVPVNFGIIFGGVLSGIGNATSTYLAWEVKRKHFIEVRLLTDFPKVSSKLNIISQRIFYLYQVTNLSKIDIDKNLPEQSVAAIPENCIQDGDGTNFSKVGTNKQSTANREGPILECCIEKERTTLSSFYHSRHLRNFVHLFFAGSLSTAGSLLGSFLPIPAGILSGGALGGIGNSMSTWLAYEQTHDAIIRKRAIKKLPKLLLDVEESEKRLIAVIVRIKNLHPEFITSNLLKLSTMTPAEDKVQEEEEDEDKYIRRNFFNLSYMTIAGGMSLGGALLAGFYSQLAGIIIGGIIGGLANSASTWLAWEKKNDKKVEFIAINSFPLMVQKIVDVWRKIECLETYAEKVKDVEASF